MQAADRGNLFHQLGRLLFGDEAAACSASIMILISGIENS